MSLTIFNDPFFDFERALDQSVDRAFGRNITPAATRPTVGDLGAIFKPLEHAAHAFDVVERKDKFELIADAPGMNPEDIKIELHDNMIVVSGSHKEAKYVEEPPAEGAKGAHSPTLPPRVWRSERHSFQFSRTFVLPENTDADKISAGLDKGILTVSIPKMPEVPKPAPKRITVTATHTA